RVCYKALPPGVVGPEAGYQAWWRYDGGTSAPPTVIGSGIQYWGRAPALAFGDDTGLLANQYYSSGAGVVRGASDGRIVSPYRDVAAGPVSSIFPGDMVRRGPEAVVRFFSYDHGLYLARITP